MARPAKIARMPGPGVIIITMPASRTVNPAIVTAIRFPLRPMNRTIAVTGLRSTQLLSGIHGRTREVTVVRRVEFARPPHEEDRVRPARRDRSFACRLRRQLRAEVLGRKISTGGCTGLRRPDRL